MVMTHEAMDNAVEQVSGLYAGAMGPTELISVLEDLITEGTLAPIVARRIEEAVLRQTDRTGTWKGAR
jgi:hypothetical protein